MQSSQDFQNSLQGLMQQVNQISELSSAITQQNLEQVISQISQSSYNINNGRIRQILRPIEDEDWQDEEEKVVVKKVSVKPVLKAAPKIPVVSEKEKADLQKFKNFMINYIQNIQDMCVCTENITLSSPRDLISHYIYKNILNTQNILINKCNICVHPRKTYFALYCSHIICDTCYKKVQQCPFCKKAVTYAIEFQVENHVFGFSSDATIEVVYRLGDIKCNFSHNFLMEIYDLISAPLNRQTITQIVNDKFELMCKNKNDNYSFFQIMEIFLTGDQCLRMNQIVKDYGSTELKEKTKMFKVPIVDLSDIQKKFMQYCNDNINLLNGYECEQQTLSIQDKEEEYFIQYTHTQKITDFQISEQQFDKFKDKYLIQQEETKDTSDFIFVEPKFVSKKDGSFRIVYKVSDFVAKYDRLLSIGIKTKKKQNISHGLRLFRQPVGFTFYQNIYMFDVQNAYPSVNLSRLKEFLPNVSQLDMILRLYDKFRVKIFGNIYKIKGLPPGLATSNQLFHVLNGHICAQLREIFKLKSPDSYQIQYYVDDIKIYTNILVKDIEQKVYDTYKLFDLTLNKEKSNMIIFHDYFDLFDFQRDDQPDFTRHIQNCYIQKDSEEIRQMLEYAFNMW